jgi:predicted O-methyltransferase YrrM
MPSVERLLARVPGGGRAYYSARWLVRLLRLWRSRARVTLAYPPGHYASPLPDPADISGVLPKLTGDGGHPAGVELNAFAQLDLLAALGPLAADPGFPAHPTPGWRYCYENPFFTYADAAVLHALLRHLRPRRVIEVGSGYSSAVMLDTRDRHPEVRPEFVFVEPHPDRLHSLLTPADRGTCTVVESRVQWVPVDEFRTLGDGDVLFIDSSHVSKIGSDVNYLVFQVLPALRPGVWVHVHDIFWPFEYPKAWYDLGWAWNEAYLLRAFLQYNAAFEVRLFLSYLESEFPKELAGAVPAAARRAAATPHTGGSSLWLRKVR